jgi:hypothetical protein
LLRDHRDRVPLMSAASHAAERFPFAWAPAYRRAARPFGIEPDNAWVAIDEREILARYGRWSLRTPLANVTAIELTGPYRFIKTAGGPRLGITDFGLTFASNGERGVLITFARRVRGVGPIPHGELTVTVADPSALSALLRERTAAAAL